ncbi:MgtC/SapB family protein, partial [Mycobacterium sp. CBMA361]|nr:MgtC/SapB family protein [Mycolicibacterium sp. CBMA 361]
LARRLASRLGGSVRLHITYADDRGVLRDLLQACGRRNWQVADLETDPPGEPLEAPPGHVGVQLTLAGSGVMRAADLLALVDGVTGVRQLEEDPD